MAHYVDSSTQTIIAGLSKHPSPVPTVLSHHIDTTTPPDEMPTKELQLSFKATPTMSNMSVHHPNISPSILVRRKKRPPLVTRISLPSNEYTTETPRSPPTTLAIMSPLPAANLLHAGHTPVFPRSLSPLGVRDDRSGQSTPELEEALSGPLTLPPQPGDGAADRIELRALDAELKKVAMEQKIESCQSDVLSSPNDSGTGGPSSPKGPRSSEHDIELVDGVILKKPMMNFGQPLGQA